MGAKEDLDAIFPDGIPVDDPEALVEAAEGAGEKLSDDDYQKARKSLREGIDSNERQKEILAAIKFVIDLGLTVKKLV